MTVSAIPQSDIDLYTDEALDNPYELYKQLRDLGPVVYLNGYDTYALPRYREVRQVSADRRSTPRSARYWPHRCARTRSGP